MLVRITKPMRCSKPARLSWPIDIFETLENTVYDLWIREPQATTQPECLVTCEVAIRGILCSLTIARDSKLHFFENPSELPNDLQKRMRTPARQVMVNLLRGPVGIRCLDRGSDQATSCNQICLAFRRINRVRLKLGLRDEKLLVVKTSSDVVVLLRHTFSLLKHYGRVGFVEGVCCMKV